jgi:hypothetical protein
VSYLYIPTIDLPILLQEICGLILRIYYNRSQTHENGKGRAIPRKRIHKWDFLCSAGKQGLGIYMNLTPKQSGRSSCSYKKPTHNTACTPFALFHITAALYICTVGVYSQLSSQVFIALSHYSHSSNLPNTTSSKVSLTSNYGTKLYLTLQQHRSKMYLTLQHHHSKVYITLQQQGVSHTTTSPQQGLSHNSRVFLTLLQQGVSL